MPLTRTKILAAASASLAFIVAGPILAQETPPDLPFEVIVPDYTEDRQAAYEVAAARSA